MKNVVFYTVKNMRKTILLEGRKFCLFPSIRVLLLLNTSVHDYIERGIFYRKKVIWEVLIKTAYINIAKFEFCLNLWPMYNILFQQYLLYKYNEYARSVTGIVADSRVPVLPQSIAFILCINSLGKDMNPPLLQQTICHIVGYKVLTRVKC